MAEESPYTKDGKDGKPVGPEHDKSFHVYEFDEVPAEAPPAKADKK